MNGDILIFLQATAITLILFFLAIHWTKLCSTAPICLRRDRNIVGQGLILTAIGIMGIFAYVNDLPGTQKIIAASNQMVFFLVILLLALWEYCARLVKKILLKPTGQPSKFVIAGTRFIINTAGIISVVICRFLLAKVL